MRHADTAPQAAHATFTGLSSDEDQELKEAVCDALLERARRVVSGDGEFGRVIFGQLPSRSLKSAFLTPHLKKDSDEVTSDIAISMHGIDCRLNARFGGSLVLRPRFFLYARALPDTEELFDRRLGLRPAASLNDEAIGARRQALKNLTETPRFKALSQEERQKERQAEAARFLRSLGTEIKTGDLRDVETPDGEDTSFDIVTDEVRIPDVHTKKNEVPKKYLRVFAEIPELVLPLPWKPEIWRDAVEDYGRTLNRAVRQAYVTWAASEEGVLWAWRKVTVPHSSFWSPEHWGARLASLRKVAPVVADLASDMTLAAVVDVRPDPLAPDTLTARFALENVKEGKNPHADPGIFGVSLQVSLPTDALCRMPMERVRRSYHFAGFLLVPAIGVNGGVSCREMDGISVLETTWCPRFVLPRMRPTSRVRVPVNFSQLMDPGLDLAVLEELPVAMERWVSEVEGNPKLYAEGESGSESDEGRQALRFQADVLAWRREAKRIRLGIEVLRRSRSAYQGDPAALAAAPYRAWLLTNEAFSKATKNPGWRLFQMGFILTHVPTLASRIPEFEDVFDAEFDEKSASLLYMSTGGGKSEAFFGTLVFALFLDRLRGKRRGVTAMLHYPLRLLTLQQARRLMRLLATAETLRHSRQLGGAVFEMGFWVGGSNTPNQTSEASGRLKPELADIPLSKEDPFLRKEERMLEERTEYRARNDAWNKLPDCPFCGASTGMRIFEHQENRLGIVCSAPTGQGKNSCDWNTIHDTPTYRAALPFLLVDTDIYLRAPAVMLGTVDKLALIGHSPRTINRIAGMFGLARFVVGSDDTGLLHTGLSVRELADSAAAGRPLAPAYAGGTELFHDPVPSLIVQDELHLLEESLGTFGGIFETTLLALFESIADIPGSRVPGVPGSPGKYRMPHFIGATATAADIDRQIQHLYQRRAVQFPHPGPRLYSSFYTELETFAEGGAAASVRGSGTTPREEESLSPWGRVYATLLTNGKTHTTATIEVLASYAVGVTRWSRDLCAADPQRRARACREMVENLSGNELSARHAAALAAADAAGLHAVLARLVDLHRIMLTYVTNKKGGDQLMAALDRQVTRHHDMAGPDYEISGYDIELISGGVDIKGIQEVIAKAERTRDPQTQDVEETLRSIVATSAISHGVDVSSFNAMTFSGVPSDVAEYIQASSRVGRSHVGFSLLIPTPQNRRDRFILDNHEHFHRFLEQMIAPPAIERWADKAVKRTLPSLIQTYLMGVRFQRDFCKASVETKAYVKNLDDALSLRIWLTGPGSTQNKADLCQFLQCALGVERECAGAPNPPYYRQQLAGFVEDMTSELLSERHTGSLSDFWDAAIGVQGMSKPMTSLRDVDQGGTLWAASSPAMRKSDIRGAMDFVTKRMFAGKRTSSRNSEPASKG